MKKYCNFKLALNHILLKNERKVTHMKKKKNKTNRIWLWSSRKKTCRFPRGIRVIFSASIPDTEYWDGAVIDSSVCELGRAAECFSSTVVCRAALNTCCVLDHYYCHKPLSPSLFTLYEYVSRLCFIIYLLLPL